MGEFSASEIAGDDQPAERWCIADLFGHQRFAGRITEVRQFGVDMCRIEVPTVDGRPGFTKDVGGSSIFSLTDVTREIATQFIRGQRIVPVQPYELAAVPPASGINDAVVVTDSPVCSDCETDPCFCDEAF